jgi:hypothetical protein
MKTQAPTCGAIVDVVREKSQAGKTLHSNSRAGSNSENKEKALWQSDMQSSVGIGKTLKTALQDLKRKSSSSIVKSHGFKRQLSRNAKQRNRCFVLKRSFRGEL